MGDAPLAIEYMQSILTHNYIYLATSIFLFIICTIIFIKSRDIGVLTCSGLLELTFFCSFYTPYYDDCRSDSKS